MNRLTSAHKVFLHEYHHPAWNLCSYCLLRKQVSFDALEAAMNEVARKNDALRMAVKNGDQVFFREYVPRRFERIEFSDEESFLSWAHERANEPVTDHPGMWTAFLIRINGRTGVYNIGHHIICDALNVANLYQKIADELEGRPGAGESYTAYLDAHENICKAGSAIRTAGTGSRSFPKGLRLRSPGNPSENARTSPLPCRPSTRFALKLACRKPL